MIEEDDTPTVLVSTNKNEAIRLIRKERKTKCDGLVYTTNYKGLYVGSRKLELAKTVALSDVKLSNYFNNKIDFLYHNLLEQMNEIYHETMLNDCKLNKEIIRNRLAMAITNPDLVPIRERKIWEDSRRSIIHISVCSGRSPHNRLSNVYQRTAGKI